MRRRNVNGIPIAAPIVTSTNLTHEEMMSLRMPYVDSVSKTNYRELGAVFEFMNATRVSLFTDTWGYYKNGSYNGMVGHLINGEAELAGSLGRTVMFILFFAFVLIYTSYSANIVALLQSKSNQIKTLSDLLNSKLEVGVEDTSYNRYFLSVKTEPVRKAMYETKVAPPGKKPNFFSLEEGVKKMQSKPFAFNMNLGIGYRMVEAYFREDEKCGLQEIQFLLQAVAWQTCRKNSAYKEIFKIGLYRNQEFGFNDHANRLIYRKKPTCAFTGSSFDSVNMIDFYPVLLLLAYGIFLAIIILFLELLYKRNRNKN
ncbi:ionotropic receptor 75a-like [Leptidea sinapis]|uniref:ionotropic receptor 75a-like n=1 Tax=Leptidea sinapis TaxID=189913 RepID=UPI0021C38748|nr:ionotropic receptor 75a-like [Leptidea sinapis]